MRSLLSVGRDKMLPYVLTLCAEDFFQHLVVDKRLCHEVPVQIQTKASDFIHAQGKGRGELSEQTVYRMVGNFPDAEKS